MTKYFNKIKAYRLLDYSMECWNDHRITVLEILDTSELSEAGLRLFSLLDKVGKGGHILARTIRFDNGNGLSVHEKQNMRVSVASSTTYIAFARHRDFRSLEWSNKRSTQISRI